MHLYHSNFGLASPKPKTADDWNDAREVRVRLFVRQLAETLQTLETVRRERDIARQQVRDLRAELDRARTRGAA